jgi:UDP-N-acetyl-D-mannosaminuronic acid transferase (WecB/TagA/CpsF family)
MHYNPPMGFVRDPDAIEATLRFIERASPFRYCLLAVGSPQQEFVAYCLKKRGAARGLALASARRSTFLTGVERRAPRPMQALGCEWLFRLLQSPRRMAYRYLVRGPRIFALLRHTEIVSRDAAVAPVVEIPEFTVPSLALQIAMPGIPAGLIRREQLQMESRRDAA